MGERPVEHLPEPPAVGDVSAAVAERSRLEAALSQLPAGQRAAVVLRYYQDLPEAQVAEALGCPSAPPGPTRHGAWHDCAGSCRTPSSRWAEGEAMDHFERELSRMLRDSEQYTP